MSDLVTIITCTGGRPDAFNLCYQYIKRQTYTEKLQWIVVNDHMSKQEAIAMTKQHPDMEVYAGPTRWLPDINTQRENMREAISHVKGNKILFIEDDDAFKSFYIEKMVKLLDLTEIVGETNAKYYHLGVPGWKEMKNYRHASLCQTGIRASLLPLLIKAVESGDKYFDINLWEEVHARKKSCVLFSELNLVIGIKGMAGREGIGAGHRVKDYIFDSNMLKLKEWLGADADNYLPFIKKRVYDNRTNTPTATRIAPQQREAGRLPTEKTAIAPGVKDSRSPEARKSNAEHAVSSQNRYSLSLAKPVTGIGIEPKGSN